ncbi:MAG: sarcosine dehydrogenase, partial [Hyphomicrobiales bacterium]|nr:sarcosine dehydrogenase [Hyphomicrobiales bacterium]
EAYGAYYKIHWPGEENEAGRNLRRSPLHAPLAAKGAVFGSKFGWERVNWFARPEDDAHDIPSFEGKPNWFDTVGAEVEAIRSRVALIDQTSFSKFEITGKDALAAMQRIAANEVPVEPGRAVYTQLCNDRGGIEADLTIVHADEDRFMVVTGSGFGVRDSHWISTHLPDDGSVSIKDVTGAYAVINLCGPKARDVLAAITDDDVSNAALPFLAAKRIAIGYAEVLAVRIGYVGELGYELYVPQEYAAHVYETLSAAGDPFGIANAGYRAIESCRLEKGYLYWSGDIGPDYDPYEAGLGFCVALDKGDFIGRAALARIAENSVPRRLVTFTLEDFVPLHGGEPIIFDGRPVGSLTSCGYGHALTKTIAFGYLPIELARETDFEIEAFGRTYAAHRGPRCLYDRKMERLKS